MQACEKCPSAGVLLGLSGVKVGDDGWKDRIVRKILNHCDKHPDLRCDEDSRPQDAWHELDSASYGDLLHSKLADKHIEKHSARRK